MDNINTHQKNFFFRPIKHISLFIFRINCIGLILFFIYGFIKHHYHPGIQYPEATFLGPAYDKFMDFFNTNYFVHQRDPYVASHSSYPPFGLSIAYLFSLIEDYSRITNEIGPHGLRDCRLGYWEYFSFMGSFLLFLYVILYRAIRSTPSFNPFFAFIITACLLCSYPIFFLIDRGNYLVYSFIFIYFFTLYYDSHKKLSAVFLGLAIAMKLYPAIFLMLYLIEKRYKEITITLSIALLVSTCSLLLFKGGFLQNAHHLVQNLFLFSKIGNTNPLQIISWSSSINALFKIIVFLKGNTEHLYHLSEFYFHALCLATFLLVYAALRHETILWRKIFILILTIISLMPFSPDYFLVYLYLPMILLIRNGSSVQSNRDKLLLLTLGLLLIPKTYKVLVHSGDYVITLQNFINPSLIYGTLLFYCYSQLATHKKDFRSRLLSDEE